VKHIAHKRIGALVIGQSPRPDLVSPLMQLIPACEIIQAGALDGLSPEELPDLSEATYPLATQMGNGSHVLVDESFISPKLQRAQNRLDAKGVAATLLLCAGTFANLHGKQPVYKPFNITCSVLKALNMNSIGLITPIPGQEVPIRQRWEPFGWKTTVWTADLGNQDRTFHQELNARINEFELDCIVLDYVGHPLAQVFQLQRSVKQPVIDLGYLSMVILANTV
jgi:protein AroM